MKNIFIIKLDNIKKIKKRMKTKIYKRRTELEDTRPDFRVSREALAVLLDLLHLERRHR